MTKIFVSTSYIFYPKVGDIRDSLEGLGFSVLLPSGYGKSIPSYRLRELNEEEFVKVKQDLFREDDKKVKESDLLLVLNFDKTNQANCIGGAVFLEMFRAYQQQKPIYLYNPIPENNFRDEIRGLAPIVINQDLTKIKLI